jgi:hypothetical protein
MGRKCKLTRKKIYVLYKRDNTSRENDSYLVFSVSTVDYQTLSAWIGDNMLCHSG